MKVKKIDRHSAAKRATDTADWPNKFGVQSLLALSLKALRFFERGDRRSLDFQGSKRRLLA
ncbi:MAG TPA: hypothetical protein VFV82_08260, partial [Candidatus Binatia bacterium]|nr:hypothetical protein [Candidatus Binatia bacterium]